MRTVKHAGELKREFLRTVYELADGRARVPVEYRDVGEELGISDDELDRTCEYWEDRSCLEWTPYFGQFALTVVGLDTIDRLRRTGWHPCAPF